MQIFKKRKLRVDILTIFASLFISTVLVIILYSYKESSANVLKVGSDLIERTNQAIIEKLDDFFRPTAFIDVSNYLVSDGILNISDMKALTSFMHVILQSHPQLSSAYLADTQGNVFIESRLSEDMADWQSTSFSEVLHIPENTKYVSEILFHKNNASLLTAVYKTDTGEHIKEEKNIRVSYDPFKRPWYVGAINSSNQYWIGVYKFYSTKRPGITIAFPLKFRNKLVGVAAADLSIDLIAQQLKNFSVSSKGTVFIINNREEIISYEKNLMLKEIGGGLPHLSNLDDPLITMAYRKHRELNQNNFMFSSHGVKYIAHFTPYALTPKETWEIASVMPIDIFIGTLKRTDQQTLIFSLVMLTLGLLLVIFSAHRISKPVMRLAEETKEIMKLRFDKEISINTHIYEIQVMIDSLTAAKSALFSFAKYVPKTLVEQLLKTRIIAQLGGEKKNITVLFTDIANFTSTAEQADPEALMLHLSEYLNSLTQIIQKYQGNIDKYIGDAIMAFWGAPLEDAKHMLHACQATLACQQEVNTMNAQWVAQGKPVLLTRFGLNSGTAIVGNMGSSDRLNYTAIGDTINLAARLEALNKIYHTEIIVSQLIYEQCANQFLFRPLDIIKVRGKTQPTAVYELVAGKPDATHFPATAQQIKLCELSWQGYEFYQKQDFKQALAIFKNIRTLFPKDTLAEIYIARCEEKLQ